MFDTIGGVFEKWGVTVDPGTLDRFKEDHARSGSHSDTDLDPMHLDLLSYGTDTAWNDCDLFDDPAFRQILRASQAFKSVSDLSEKGGFIGHLLSFTSVVGEFAPLKGPKGESPDELLEAKITEVLEANCQEAEKLFSVFFRTSMDQRHPLVYSTETPRTGFLFSSSDFHWTPAQVRLSRLMFGPVPDLKGGRKVLIAPLSMVNKYIGPSVDYAFFEDSDDDEIRSTAMVFARDGMKLPDAFRAARAIKKGA